MPTKISCSFCHEWISDLSTVGEHRNGACREPGASQGTEEASAGTRTPASAHRPVQSRWQDGTETR